MDSIIQIETLHYAKIYGERRLFHNRLGKNGNLKPLGSLHTLLLLWFIIKLNCVACCPWNFEAFISRNILD